MTSTPPASVPIPSATLLLVQDTAAGLQVFMIARHRQTARFGGALVFPGGKVAVADTDPRLRRWCRGQAQWSDTELALRIAALRETFEESGLLLARHRASGEFVSAATMAALAPWRSELEDEKQDVLTLLDALQLELATDLPVPIGHWVTPEGTLKRFDTHFYVARLPADQQLVHGGREAVDSLWAAPGQLLMEAEQGRWEVVFPTRCHLARLAQYTRVESLLEATRRTPVVTVSPQVLRSAGQIELRIPADAGYPLHVQVLEQASS